MDAGTTTKNGKWDTCVTGAKSPSGSYGSLPANTSGWIDIVEPPVTSSV